MFKFSDDLIFVIDQRIRFFFILFFPFFLKGSIKSKLLIPVLGILVFGIVFSVYLPIRERMNRYVILLREPSALRANESAFERTWLMKASINLIAENPFLGIGVDNARDVLVTPYRRRRGIEGQTSHNNYTEMSLNAGLLGAILFYIPLVYIFLKVKKEHPYWLTLKTFITLYLLLGVGMVQYKNFVLILFYSLIVFLYFNYEGVSTDEEDLLHCQYS